MDAEPPPELEETPPSNPPVSRLAVASLVLGLLPCTSVAGLICGILAKSRIAKSQGSLGGNGLATAGIVVSAISTLLILPAILAGMLVPALAKADAKAKQIKCVNNLKMIGLECRLYAVDRDGKYPPGYQQFSDSTPTKVLVCPADPKATPASDWAHVTPGNTSYPYFGAKVTEDDIEAVVACCTNHGHANFLMADGSVLRLGARKDAPVMRLEGGRMLLKSR